MFAAVQSGAMPAISCRNRLQHLLAVRGVQHLGVVLHAGEPAGPVLERGDGRARARGGHRRSPSGASVTASPWLIHTGWVDGSPSCSTTAGCDVSVGAAVLAGAGAGDRAAERLRHRLEAVADAEHRDARVEQRRVELRGALARRRSTARRTG